MSDQKKWFKVWTSIIDDPDFEEMSLEDIGRWTLLGASTALNGSKGVLQVPGEGKHLCRLIRVSSFNDAKTVISRLPKVVLNCHDVRTVTFSNWLKYQVDDSSKRQEMSRSKKRREEKREEEKRRENKKKKTTPNGVAKEKAASQVKPSRPSPDDPDWVKSLKANPAYQGIDVDRMIGKMRAWCEVRGKEPTRARLLNWLNREDKPMRDEPKVDTKELINWAKKQ